MMEIRNIVVPFDFSARCRAAAAHAAAFADRFEAPITLLHVIPYSSFEYAAFEGGAYVGAVWPSEEQVEARLKSEIAELPALAAAAENCRTAVLKGEPPRCIAEFVSGTDAPLVVMPTHGHGAFRRFVLGSVTAKTLHDLTCPVLTGAHMEDQAFGGGGYRKVACALDLAEHSPDTLRYAVDFAKSWGAELSVVHASNWLAGVEADEAMLPKAVQKRVLDNVKGELAALMRELNCSAEMKVGFGRAADFVPKAVEELGADILVTGRRTEKSGAGLGPHAYEIIRSAPCPVLSV